VERQELLNILNLVKPGLSDKDIIPIFCHFCFDGEKVVAYNDVIGIQHPCDVDVEGAIRGSLLLSLLDKSTGSKADIKQKGDVGVELSVDVDKHKLPLLTPDHFLFKFPTTKPNRKVLLNESYVTAIERCLLSINETSSQAEQMGITLILGEDSVCFSTDAVSMTQYIVDASPVKGSDVTILLPLEFCKSFLHLASELGVGGDDDVVLLVGDDFAVVDFGGGRKIFTRLIGSEPLDFLEVIDSNCGELDEGDFVPLPAGFKEALDKATLYYNSTINAKCQFTIAKNRLTISTRTDSFGEQTASLRLKGDHPDISIFLNPNLLYRAIDYATCLVFLSRCLVFRDDVSYQYMVATSPST